MALVARAPGARLLAAATLSVTLSQSILESIIAIWALHKYGFGPRTVGFLLFGVALPALLMQGGACASSPQGSERRAWRCSAYSRT